MNNISKRLILAGIAIPVLLVLIFLTPWVSHGLFNLIVIVFAFKGGQEMAEMLKRRGFPLNSRVSGIISTVPVLAVYLELVIPSIQGLILPVMVTTASLVVLKEVFPGNEEAVRGVVFRISGYLMILLYPGFFLTYIIRLSSFSESSAVILVFIALVFSNDSFAYIFGMIFGKNNRGIFRVSPNKSLAGFFGGLGGTVLAAFITSRIFPQVFLGRTEIIILAGVVVSLLAVVGDLIESAIKRSAEVKDSGQALKGRGGVMDSLDSLLYCAPFYFYLINFLQ